jgi:glycine cleavage system transcriptional repressor
LGLDYTAVVHVTGNWSGIAKMEAGLPILAKQYQIDFLCKRTQYEKTDEQFLPYTIQIFSLDQPGIIYEISDFLETQDIRVERWKTTSYLTINDTPVFSMKTVINFPASSNIADFRENFLMFCDELNLDGTLEPEQR